MVKTPGYPFIGALLGIVDAPVNGIPDITMQDKNGCIMFNFRGYCVKCHLNRNAYQCKRVILKNGRDAMRGICRDCGSAIFKIGRY